MALDGVRSFLNLKDVKVCKTVQLYISWVGFPQCSGGKLEEAENIKCAFVVYCVLASKKICSSSLIDE